MCGPVTHFRSSPIRRHGRLFSNLEQLMILDLDLVHINNLFYFLGQCPSTLCLESRVHLSGTGTLHQR